VEQDVVPCAKECNQENERMGQREKRRNKKDKKMVTISIEKKKKKKVDKLEEGGRGEKPANLSLPEVSLKTKKDSRRGSNKNGMGGHRVFETQKFPLEIGKEDGWKDSREMRDNEKLGRRRET